MNRLMKAEFYRFIHTGNFFGYVIFMTILFAVVPFLTNIENMGMTLGGLLGMDIDKVVTGPVSVDFTVMLGMMIIPPAIAAVSGQLYNKGKLGNYEVMTGSRPSRIILSKIFTDGLIFFIASIIGLMTFYIYIAVVNGVGGFDHAAGRLALALILLAQVCSASVMIMMIERRPGIGAVMCYVRFMLFDTMCLPCLMFFAGTLGYEKLALHLAHMSIINKIQMVLHSDITTMQIMHTIFGFIAEFILWYVIIYRKHKNKKFD